jgi:hypothetical protein
MFARELLPILGPGAALAVIGSVNQTATAAGTTQATATAITTVTTHCTTATEGQGFVLPPSMTANDQATVCNATSVTIYVYPPTGGKLNGATANIPISLPANSARDFICANGTDWIAT